MPPVVQYLTLTVVFPESYDDPHFADEQMEVHGAKEIGPGLQNH